MLRVLGVCPLVYATEGIPRKPIGRFQAKPWYVTCDPGWAASALRIDYRKAEELARLYDTGFEQQAIRLGRRLGIL